MTEIPDPNLLAQQRDRIRNQLASIGDFRPGNLTEYYRKCGKPYCRCTQPEHPGHGPSWMLTRKVDSKTLTRNVPQASPGADPQTDEGVSAIPGFGETDD